MLLQFLCKLGSEPLYDHEKSGRQSGTLNLGDLQGDSVLHPQLSTAAKMTSEGEVMEAAMDKKRERDVKDEAEHSAAGMNGHGNDVAEEVMEGDAENASAKRAKTEETAPVKTLVDVEVKVIVDNVTPETIAAVNDGAAAESKKGPARPGGWKEGRKRKIAMILAYCGAAYQGMQKNPGAITIEAFLEQALFRANAIAQCNFGNLQKVDWMRAARTDKGVSAVGQIVSARLVIDPPGFVERVNQHLPKDIRVFGYSRVTSNFNAKQMCDKRRYEYLIPVFACNPHAHHDRDTMLMWEERKENVRLQRIEKRKALEQKAAGSEEASQPKAEARTVEVREAIIEVVKDTVEKSPEQVPYEFDEGELHRLNEILSRYKGTHNFHNFTARIKPEDPSAKRFILSFEAGKVIEVQGMQFVPCTVIGQSFMLHQIRKMIGLALAIMRGCVPASIIDFALKRENDVTTPMAPELGLFLDECFYTAYNKKFSYSHEEITQKGYEELIRKFKHDVIHPHIATTEAMDGTMALWLHSLNDRHYPYFVTFRESAKV